jgi:DNA-binding PadR family transcriptional regulator
MLRHRFLMGHPPFPGPHPHSPFQKGDMKYVILDLLKEKPQYGYEIIRALEEQSHGFYRPSAGAVYPTLQMLEEMGHASSTDRDGKKVYAITNEGRRFLEEHSDWADEIKDHMSRHWNRKNYRSINGIMDEFSALVESVGYRISQAEPEKLERIRKVVANTRKEIEAILKE